LLRFVALRVERAELSWPSGPTISSAARQKSAPALFARAPMIST